MARHRTLTDQDILALARPLFMARGVHVKCRELSAAVGLTWGAIALRFGCKRGLFLQAMQAEGPVAPAADTDLGARLRGLRSQLATDWPMHLQLSLSSAASPQLDVASLASALQRHAERGEVRADLAPLALARLVLATLTGAAAEGFVQRQHGAPPDDSLVETLLCLLIPRSAGKPTDF